MTVRILIGDCREKLRELPDASVHCCVTSPPYFGLRDYGVDGQMGLEPTPDEFVAGMVEVFREVRRVLRDDGVLFLNMGDSYFGGGGHAPDAPSSATSKSGKYGAKGALIKGHTAGGRRGPANGSGDTEGSGSLGRGSSSRNRGGERTDVWWSHIADTDAGRALALVAEPLTQIQACMEELLDRLPNADCALLLPSEQSSAAILDQAQSAILAAERLLASLPSIPVGCVPPLLASSRLSDSASACLWSLRSFAACVRRCAHMLDAPSETIARTADIASLCEELEQHIRCTSACCSTVSSWVEFKPERSTSQLKPKDLIGIPWMLAFALRADGWFLRQDIIWSKPNPMPESVRDRCTKAHEYLFLLSKGPRYYYDQAAIAEPVVESSLARWAQNVEAQAGAERVLGKTNGPMKAVGGGKVLGRGVHGSSQARSVGTARADRSNSGGFPNDGSRNKRSVWEVATQPFSEAHFATYPPALIEPCILAGCPAGGTVLDPFGGAGTTGLVADRLGRNAILIELNPEYAAIAERRLNADSPLFAEVKAA